MLSLKASVCLFAHIELSATRFGCSENTDVKMATTSVRWGIIGCGDVTERKSGPGFQRARNSELAAVMRRDADKAKDFATRHGVPRWHSSVEDLLNDDTVDAVYVATTPGSHLELALQVVAAGKPCYMEKPMARNFAESSQMANAFQDAGVPLFVAYYRRAYPRFQRLKSLIGDGTIGELSAVHYTLRKPPIANPSGWRHVVASSGGGLFVDVGSHALDLLDYLLGPLREVQGAAARAPGLAEDVPEDVVTASFLVGENIIGSASWNFRADGNLDLLEIIGTRGRALLPDTMNGAECIVEFNDGEPTQKFSIDPPAPAVQEPLIQTVVDAILAGDASLCPSTGPTALRTAQYIDSILEGFYAGRGDAFWDRPHTWQPEVSSKRQRAEL